MSFKYFHYLYTVKLTISMRIYTSYFANGKKLSAAGVRMVGITLYPPKWFNGPNLKQVAPTYAIFNISDAPDEIYNARFRKEVLARVNAQQFVQKLQQLTGGHDVALCCYERPDEKCHRHLVGQWLEEQLGIKVIEFGSDGKPKYIEPDLFG